MSTKTLLESSLEAFEERRNPKTGWIHQSDHAIALYENALYVLALFRTHRLEAITKAKKRLFQLLSLQVEGNFPPFLHDYPFCYGRENALNILVVLHLIIRDYSQVIDQQLHDHLKQAIERTKELLKEQNPSLLLDVLLDKTTCFDLVPESIDAFNDYLIALSCSKQTVDLNRIAEKWDSNLKVFQGLPSFEKGEPQLTYCDLFMATLFDTTLPRLKNQPSLLLVPLLPKQSFTPISSSESFCHMTDNALLMLWGSAEQIDSLAIDEPECSISKKGDAIFIDLPTTIPEQRGDHYELNIYASRQFLINGVKATCGTIGDTITIPGKYKLQFSASSGDFYLHVSRANRPAEIDKTQFAAYDWRLAIRTVKRIPECQIKLLLTPIIDQSSDKSAPASLVGST